eukprot:Em0002g746a
MSRYNDDQLGGEDQDHETHTSKKLRTEEQRSKSTSTATLSKSQASYQLTASSNCWSTTIFADCDKLKVVKPADDHDGGYTLVDIVGTIPDDESKSKKLLNWLIDLLRWQALEEQDRFTNETNKAPPVKGQLYYCCDYVPLSTIGKLLMQPLAASQQHKPDVALIMNGLPVIQFEINSSPISTTVAKLFANLVDVLRFIRHFDLKINTWTGFAFPKVKVDSSNNYAFKVGVRWKDLQFAPEVSALKLRDIAQEVKDTFNMQVDLVQKLYVSEEEVMHKEMYLVPLSDADIHYFANALQPSPSSASIKQVESPFSILLCDGNYYYKYSPKAEVRETLFKLWVLEGSLLSSNLILPHKMKEIGPMVFFVFHAVKYNNLSKDIAKTCLGELANGIARGLRTLHDLGFAHLDVRLPNVCVGEDFEVKLIDFDRATKDESYQNSDFFMYTLEKEGKSSKDLDWKQLGLLLFSLSSDVKKDQQELKRQDIPINRESFLGKLIWEHEYDQNAMQLWISKLLPTQNVSLRNVFEVL